MSPVRGLVLAGASRLAQAVPTYHGIKVQDVLLTRADGPLDAANENQQPSLRSLLISALRIAAMAGVAVFMVRLLLNERVTPFCMTCWAY